MSTIKVPLSNKEIDKLLDGMIKLGLRHGCDWVFTFDYVIGENFIKFSNPDMALIVKLSIS